MKKVIVSVLLFPVLLLVGTSVHAIKIYKWTDGGSTQYSDRPPVGAGSSQANRLRKSPPWPGESVSGAASAQGNPSSVKSKALPPGTAGLPTFSGSSSNQSPGTATNSNGGGSSGSDATSGGESSNNGARVPTTDSAGDDVVVRIAPADPTPSNVGNTDSTMKSPVVGSGGDGEPSPVSGNGSGASGAEDLAAVDSKTSVPGVDAAVDSSADSAEAESSNGVSEVEVIVISAAGQSTQAVAKEAACNASTSPSSGLAHAHFKTLVADSAHRASWHLRTAAQIDCLIVKDGKAPGPSWEYDSQMDAARLTIPAGETMSLSSKDQLFMNFPAVTAGNSSMLAIQWEMRWSEEWKDRKNNPGNPGSVMKAIRLDYLKQSGKDDRVIEFQPEFADVTNEVVGYPRIRAYDIATTEPFLDGTNPIRLRPGPVNTLDEQPGGYTAAFYGERPFKLSDRGQPGKPFLMVPNQWIRVTWIWEFVGSNDHRLTMLMSDENTGETVVFASVANPGKGMNIYRRTNSDSGGDLLRAEFNRSNPGFAGVEHQVWLRNVVVFKDKKIPHGGTPRR